MRPGRLLLGVIAVTALVVSGCEQSGTPKAPTAFCTAARKLDDRLTNGAKLDEQVLLVQKLVDTAPKSMKPDARMFLDALRRVRTDPSVKDNPKVRKAVQHVNRYAAQGCGFYQQQSPI